MGTGGHAVKRARLVRADIESVLIPGAGPIGLGVLSRADSSRAAASRGFVAFTRTFHAIRRRRTPSACFSAPGRRHSRRVFAVISAELCRYTPESSSEHRARQVAYSCLNERAEKFDARLAFFLCRSVPQHDPLFPGRARLHRLPFRVFACVNVTELHLGSVIQLRPWEGMCIRVGSSDSRSGRPDDGPTLRREGRAE